MPSLNFKGKALVQNYHLLVPYHELKPIKSKSLTNKVSLHDNLIVHGDKVPRLSNRKRGLGGRAQSAKPAQTLGSFCAISQRKNLGFYGSSGPRKNTSSPSRRTMRSST